jgi:xylulokinase
MNESFIIAHDLGTSGTKAVLTDMNGTIIASAESHYPVYYSPDGGAEQDPEEWWKAIVETTHNMMRTADIAPEKVAGLSMSAQMVGTLPVDVDGKPLRRAMIWLDARAEAEAEFLRNKTGFNHITGKSPSAKVLWIMRHEPDIYARTHKMLDCKDFLQFRMTGVFATDQGMAGATSYFNRQTRSWWPLVLDAMELPVEKLPEPISSTDIVGELTAKAATELGLVEGTPVISGGGDLPCAVIGSGAISPGHSHLYLGTSAWVIASTKEFISDVEGIFASIGIDDQSYLLGGEMDNAGGCTKWFLENLMGKEDEAAAAEAGKSIFQYMDQLAAEIPPGAEELIFLPWVWGERAPVNDDNVRGGFVNLGLNHTKGHMIRALLEGVGCHLRWIFNTVESAGVLQKEANVIGGGATSPFWLQILADITNIKLLQVEQPLDACARGAAMTAAVGLKYYKNFAEVEQTIKLTGAEFTPNQENREVYDTLYKNFRSLYSPLSSIGNNLVPPVNYTV